MATSILTVGSKAQTFKDLDLLALVCLLGRQLEEAPAASATVAPFVTKWKQQIATYGPGTIDLDLDNLATSERAKVELLDLLAAVDGALSRFGEALPSSFLNSECSPPGVQFSDYPTSLLSAAIRSLQMLLLSDRA